MVAKMCHVIKLWTSFQKKTYKQAVSTTWLSQEGTMCHLNATGALKKPGLNRVNSV